MSEDRAEADDQEYAQGQRCAECGGGVTEVVTRDRETGDVRRVLSCNAVGCSGQREVPQSVQMQRAGAAPLPGF